MTADEEAELKRDSRAIINRNLLRILRGMCGFLQVFAYGECKSVGNMNPEGFHCFTCTFGVIYDRVKRAVQFWEEGDKYKDALS